MRLLLDTHVLIWALGRSARLSPTVRKILTDPDNDIFFSAASIWEIAIKAQLGRADFPIRSADIARAARLTGFVQLPVLASAAALVETLPLYHRDPFDRILVAQAINEPLLFYSADPVLKPYSDLVTIID